MGLARRAGRSARARPEPAIGISRARSILEPVERFQSVTQSGKLVSLSFWRDE